jgi:hypothetical protein
MAISTTIISRGWQQCLACIVLHSLFPLLPVGLELLITKGVSIQTLMITTAIYVITIGSLSRSILFFTFTILISVLFSAGFGLVMGGGEVPGYASTATVFVLFVIFLAYSREKYVLHVIEKAECLSFKPKPSDN